MKADIPPPGHRSARPRTAERPARARSERTRQPRSVWRILSKWLLVIPVLLGITGVLVAAMGAAVAWHHLPPIDVLTQYRPKVPMHIYSADGVLIGEFGDERRTIVHIEDFPPFMKQAILAAEDDSFYAHNGIDFNGVARAALANLRSGGRGQGASTITMQLARTFFLSRERSYTRKLYEMLMSLKIEQALTKDQILEIYTNQIFLGQRAYGFAAAAETYFGKPLAELNLAQYAMLAGLPKAPSTFNPVVNPTRARERQRYVLSRMADLGYITAAQAEEARGTDVRVRSTRGPRSSEDRQVMPWEAQWISEMARQMTYDLFKSEAYTSGLKVYTTINLQAQRDATAAVHKAVVAYDRKYGYRGPEGFVRLQPPGTGRDEQIEDAVSQAGEAGEMKPAVVLAASPTAVTVRLAAGEPDITLSGAGLKFALRALNGKDPAERQLRPGSVVRIQQGDDGKWSIVQVPEVESAFVSLDTRNGAVRAMVGGFDFNRSKFNRATQSIRQPGSALKPFIYSAALEKGFMASTLINDAPVLLDPAETGGQLWEPKNSDGRYDGPITLRSALARSKNMVSIRILQNIGVDYAQGYLARFGFPPDRNPAYLTMALGAGAATPWQLAGGISVFANGGYRIEPYLIQRITDMNGKEIAAAHPLEAGTEADRLIDPRNAYLIDSMLRDVVRKGTAKGAMVLKRNDLAGKTGTTNEAHDAWFVGYASHVAGVAWMGFDQPRSLGEREFGGGLALPVWISAMRNTLAGVPEQPREPPPGLVTLNSENYYAEYQPGTGIGSLGLSDAGLAGSDSNGEDSVSEQERNIRDELF